MTRLEQLVETERTLGSALSEIAAALDRHRLAIDATEALATGCKRDIISASEAISGAPSVPSETLGAHSKLARSSAVSSGSCAGYDVA